MVFVGQGTVEQGDDFFADLWPDAPVISDVDQTLAQAFGIRRGGWRQLVGPEVLMCSTEAVLKGKGVGKPTGDVRQLPAAVLVYGDRVLWRYDGKHAGDRPDWRQVGAIAEANQERAGVLA